MTEYEYDYIRFEVTSKQTGLGKFNVAIRSTRKRDSYTRFDNVPADSAEEAEGVAWEQFVENMERREEKAKNRTSGEET